MSFQDIKKAIKKDKLKAVKKLVEADPAIVNIQNSDGETPLFVAVHEEHPEIVTYLIENGADVNHKSTKDGWTVLHIACFLKNAEIVNILLDNNVDINVTSNTGATPLYLVCEHGSHNEMSIDIIYDLILAAEELGVLAEYINKKEEHGYFPLYVACKNGDNDIVELLLEKGANLEEKNEQRQTALIIAIQENQEKSHLEVIETLLKAGADLLYTDNTGHTALDWAQQNDDDDVIRLLIQYAPSPSSSISSTVSSRSRSTSSRTSSNTSSNTSSKSKSFSVGSVEPTALDVVTIKQSKLPETAEDFINMEDVNIADFLAESDKNRIIKVHNSFYALNGEDLKGHFLSKAEKNNYVYYPCKRALPPPALGVSKDDVHMDKPLFSASYLVGVLSDFVLLSEVMAMLDSEHKYFEILANSEVHHVPATASAQMFTSRRNAVSANHCQEGKEAKILKLKRLDIVETSSSSKSKEKTVASLEKSSSKEAMGTRRNKKHKSAKRAMRGKRQTLRSRRPMKSRRIYY
jgi:ankyrin repeat protein